MGETYNLERSILASLLSSEIEVEIDKNYFTNTFHQKLAVGINRLKELQLSVDFELLRNSYIKAKKWTFEEDNMLTDIMINTTPFGSHKIVEDYINVLKESYRNNLDRRYAI